DGGRAGRLVRDRLRPYRARDAQPARRAQAGRRRPQGAHATCDGGAAERVESARVLSVQRGRRHRTLPEGLRLRRLRVDQGYVRGVEPDRLPARLSVRRGTTPGGRAVVAWPPDGGALRNVSATGAQVVYVALKSTYTVTTIAQFVDARERVGRSVASVRVEDGLRAVRRARDAAEIGCVARHHNQLPPASRRWRR